MGIIFLGIFTCIDRGVILPVDATSYNWKILGISGLIGLFLEICFYTKPML